MAKMASTVVQALQDRRDLQVCKERLRIQALQAALEQAVLLASEILVRQERHRM